MLVAVLPTEEKYGPKEVVQGAGILFLVGQQAAVDMGQSLSQHQDTAVEMAVETLVVHLFLLQILLFLTAAYQLLPLQHPSDFETQYSNPHSHLYLAPVVLLAQVVSVWAVRATIS